MIRSLLSFLTFVQLFTAGSSLAGPKPDLQEELFQNTADLLREEFSQTVHPVRIGKLIQTQPKIIKRIRRMVLETQSELILTTFICDPEAPLTRALVDSIRELHANVKKAHKKKDTESYSLPIRLRFLSSRKVGIARLFGNNTSDDALTCFDGLRNKLDPELIQFEYSNYEHSSVGCSHAKYIIRDGHEILLTSMNLAQRTFFEIGTTLDSRRLAKEIYKDFDELRALSRVVNSKVSGIEARNTGFHGFSGLKSGSMVPSEFSSHKSKALVIKRPSSGNLLSWNEDNSQDRAFRELFRSAKSSIKIMTPNLNFKNYKEEFIAAIERGVNVDIILSEGLADYEEGKAHLQGGSNTAVVKALSDAYSELKRVEGVTGKLTIRWYLTEQKVRPFGSDYAVHAKFMSIDHSIMVIGSANMDTQSWYHSAELSIVLYDPEKTLEWEHSFFDLILNR